MVSMTVASRSKSNSCMICFASSSTGDTRSNCAVQVGTLNIVEHISAL